MNELAQAPGEAWDVVVVGDGVAGPSSALAVEPVGFTGVEGVWAAGDVADVMANVPIAAASGTRAGAVLNADLIAADAGAAAAARAALGAPDARRRVAG